MIFGSDPELDPNWRDVTTVDQMNRTQRVVLTVFFLLVVGFGAFYAWGGSQQERENDAIRATGIHVRGQITNRSLSADSQNNPTYNIDVSYAAGSIRTQHQFAVTKAAYGTTYRGSGAEVIYSRDDPSDVVLASGGQTDPGSSAILVGALISLGGLVLIAAAWIYWLKFL